MVKSRFKKNELQKKLAAFESVRPHKRRDFPQTANEIGQKPLNNNDSVVNRQNVGNDSLKANSCKQLHQSQSETQNHSTF